MTEPANPVVSNSGLALKANAMTKLVSVLDERIVDDDLVKQNSITTLTQFLRRKMTVLFPICLI